NPAIDERCGKAKSEKLPAPLRPGRHNRVNSFSLRSALFPGHALRIARERQKKAARQRRNTLRSPSPALKVRRKGRRQKSTTTNRSLYSERALRLPKLQRKGCTTTASAQDNLAHSTPPPPA